MKDHEPTRDVAPRSPAVHLDPSPPAAAEARDKRLLTLARLTETLTATLSGEDVLDRIVGATVELFESSAAGLWLMEEGGRSLSLRAHAGLRMPPAGLARFALGDGLMGEVAAARVAMVVTDIPRDPRVRNRARVEAEGILSLAGLPLLAGDRRLGVLAIGSRRERTFTDEDLSVAQSLANHAANAIENARRFAEERAREAYLAALLEVGQKIAAMVPTEAVLDGIAGEAARLLGVDNAGFRLLDGDELIVAGAVGSARATMLRERLGIGESLSGLVVQTGRTLTGPLEGSPVLPEHLAADLRLGYTTFLVVPLRARDRTIGALTFRARRAFTRAEQEMAEAFAGQAAIAIENARLYRQAAEQADHMRAVADLGRALVSTFEVDRILDIVTAHARETLGISQVGICLEEPETGRFHFVHGPRPLENLIWDVDLAHGEGLVGRALADGRPAWSADVLRDRAVPLRPETRARLESLGSRAALAVPLARGRTFGALVVLRDVGHRWSEREIEYLSVFASQVSVAVQNARLYAETRRRLEETRALLEVEEILNSTLPPRRRLKAVATKIAQVCGVDRCSIERWDGDRVHPLTAQYADGRRDDRQWAAFNRVQTYAPRDVPAYAEVLETGKPVLIADTSVSDRIPREWNELYGHQSILLVPLIRQGAIIGVLGLDRIGRTGAFEPRQVQLGVAIAGQLALSIENTRLYAEAQERLRETTTLLAVGRALSQPVSSTEVMRLVAREVGRAFRAEMASVCLLDERRDTLVPVAGYHVPKAVVRALATRGLPLGRSPWLRGALHRGAASSSADILREPGVDPSLFPDVGPASVLVAPTMVRGEARGCVVLVWWGAGRPFDPAEIRLAEGVAAHVGLALEVADLARRGQQKRQETETLQAVSRMLASTLDAEALPRLLLRHVVRALGGEAGGVWRVDETGEALVPLVGYRVPRQHLDAYRRVRLPLAAGSRHAEAIRSRRPILSAGGAGEPETPLELRRLRGDRTNLFVPIIVKDRAVGGLEVTWSEAARELDDRELSLVETVATQIGVALENAQLFEDNQRRVEELSVLHQLARAVTGQLDRAGLIETAQQHIARLLDVRHLVVLLLDESGERLDVVLRVRDGVRSAGAPRGYPRRAAGLSTVVLETAQPLRTDDYVDACRRAGVEPAAQSAGLPNWLGVPMVAAERTLGVLALRSLDRPFTERDERLLSGIADLLALALKSAELYGERTRAFAELAAAQDQLVRTEKLRAMGEMASGVAHDFNNVLASILGRAQLLRGKVADPKLARWIEVIERSAMDGARTVRRLQEFTRIRRDQPAVAVDLNQVVQETLEATEPSWRDAPTRRGVAIEATLDLAPSLPPISGDPAALRDAMTNLILNAVDAMPQGGRLGLATARVEGRVEVRVSDTGVGIPEAIRQRIFDPFFTTKGPKGTGLGLSMAYGILARHGARIAVDSAEGRGTTFRLDFPVATAAPAVAAGAEPPPAAERAGLRCLVVDDEDAVAEVLGDMLASVGHRVDVVKSGAEAVARFLATRFDVVFTDLAMPGMNGWEVARAVKAAAMPAPVVLVTGFGVEVSPQDLRQNGVDAVLAKPLRLADIHRALAALPGAGGAGV